MPIVFQMDPKQYNVVIALLTKNCAKFLPHVLKNVEAYASNFLSYTCIIVDGYSTDLTEIICKSWCRSDREHRIFGRQPSANLPRMQSLTEARNYVLDSTRQMWGPQTLLLLLDADSPNMTQEGFLTCFKRDDWDALFVNQKNTYYDLWALRDDELSEDYQIKYRGKSWNGEMQAAIAPYQKPKQPTDGDTTFHKVRSAFGGAALYKTTSIGNARYTCTTYNSELKGHVHVCEHVPFHEAIVANGGSLFINCKWYNGEHE